MLPSEIEVGGTNSPRNVTHCEESGVIKSPLLPVSSMTGYRKLGQMIEGRAAMCTSFDHERNSRTGETAVSPPGDAFVHHRQLCFVNTSSGRCLNLHQDLQRLSGMQRVH